MSHRSDAYRRSLTALMSADAGRGANQLSHPGVADLV